MIWRRIVRDYFTFNKREARGAYSLIVLLLVLSGIHLLVRFSPPTHQSVTDEEITAFKALAKSFEYGKLHDDFVNSTSLSPSTDKAGTIEWRQFDPNKADSQELVN